jgi:hypothetical protein
MDESRLRRYGLPGGSLSTAPVGMFLISAACSLIKSSKVVSLPGASDAGSGRF